MLKLEMVALKVGFAVVSVVPCAGLCLLQPMMKSFHMPADSVLTVCPIIREAVVCAERGLRQVNNP